jgi:hypothetical protein
VYYIMDLSSHGGTSVVTIVDVYDSLLEAREVVSKHPKWTIMIKYEDRPNA